MNPKVLITGASGFIGYHLIEAAQRAELSPVAAVRKSSDVTHLQSAGVPLVTLDYSSAATLKDQLEAGSYDYIIHAAGVTKAGSAAAYNVVNADYTHSLASAAKDAGIRKFVFLSSLAALGPLGDAQASPITEEQSPAPVTDYGRSKLLAEAQLQKLAGLPLVVIRPTAVYGPRERDLFIMLRSISRGLEPYIGRAPQSLSFIHATDLAEAAVGALSGEANGTYNLSDGHCYDRYELARIAKSQLDKKTIRLHLPLPLVRLMAGILEKTSGSKRPALSLEKLPELTAAGWQCSIKKAQQELGFSPTYNLENGLTQTIGWYRNNGWL